MANALIVYIESSWWYMLRVTTISQNAGPGDPISPYDLALATAVDIL